MSSSDEKLQPFSISLYVTKDYALLDKMDHSFQSSSSSSIAFGSLGSVHKDEQKRSSLHGSFVRCLTGGHLGCLESEVWGLGSSSSNRLPYEKLRIEAKRYRL